MATQISELRRGDSYSWPMTIKSGGAAIDISGWVLSMTVKADPADSDDDAQLQVDYTFPSDANSQAGLGTFKLTPDDTAYLVPGYAYMDMQLTIPQGGDDPKVKTFLSNKIKILEDVTNRVPV